MADSTPVDPAALAALAVALAKAQAEMANPVKDKLNPHFKSRYADLSSVRDAVLPCLNKHGLCVIQTVDRVGDADVLVTTLLHEKGGQVASRYPIRPVKGDPQGFGSAVTYARRYSLSALVCVAADEDDDGNSGSTAAPAPRVAAEPPKQSPPKQLPAASVKGITPEYAAKVKLLLAQAAKALDSTTEAEVQGVLNHHNIAELADLTREQADTVMRWSHRKIVAHAGNQS